MTGIAAFAVFAAILAITPGLDTMLVLRTTAVSGRAAGIAAVTGVALGCLVWAVASAAGVTAVLAASRVAFEILRAAGVAYLFWLGGRALWHARRPDPTPSPAAPPPAAPSPAVPASAVPVQRWGSALRTGFTTNLLNPKVGVFYLSVMPQFLPGGLSPLAGSLALGAIHIGEGFVWLSIVVLAVNLARGWLTRPTVRRRLEQCTGVVFIAFGVRLALNARSP
jgi:threonine/homoserine/homoserine lactone efflux protein